MTGVIRVTPEIERERWLAERRTYLGANDVSAILGLNPYSSPLAVYCDKRGEKPPQEQTAAMKRGLRLEPYIAALYSDHTGRAVEKWLGPIRPPDKPHLGVNPDYSAQDDDGIRLVECKSHHWTVAHHYGEPGTDQAPDWEVIQATWQIHLARKVGFQTQYCDVAALLGVGEEDFRVYPVRYDEELAGTLEEEADRFWQDHVIAGVPPAVSGTDSDLLKSLYPVSRERSVAATPEIEGVCAALRKARLARKEAEIEVETLEATIKAFMGDAGVLETSLGPHTWKTSKGSPRYKAVAEEMGAPPSLIAKHTPEFGARVFRVPYRGE